MNPIVDVDDGKEQSRIKDNLAHKKNLKLMEGVVPASSFLWQYTRQTNTTSWKHPRVRDSSLTHAR